MIHRKYHGSGRQQFYIIVDMERFAEYLGEQIWKSLNDDRDLIRPEITDWEYNIDSLRLEGNYDFNYTEEYFSATRECPEEHDIERPYLCGDCDIGSFNTICISLLKYVPAEIRDLISITCLKEEEEFDEI